MNENKENQERNLRQAGRPVASLACIEEKIDAKSTEYVLTGAENSPAGYVVFPIYGIAQVFLNVEKTKLLVEYTEYIVTVEGENLHILLGYYHKLTVSKISKGEFSRVDDFNKQVTGRIERICLVKREF